MHCGIDSGGGRCLSTEIMSWGWGPRRGRPPPERANVSYAHVLSFVVAQDVGHAGERDHSPSRRVNVLSAYSLWPVLGVDRGNA